MVQNRHNKNRKISTKKKIPYYRSLPEFWGVSAKGSYKWIESNYPVDDLFAMLSKIMSMQVCTPKVKAKAFEVMEILNRGETVEYLGKQYKKDDENFEPTIKIETEKIEPAKEVQKASAKKPKQRRLTNAEKQIGKSLTLDELIEWLGGKLQGAIDQNDMPSFATFQPWFLKAVSARDQTELAAKKLGIDSLEVITRENFTNIIRVIAWHLVNNADTIAERVSQVSINKKTQNDVYNAVHPIIIKKRFESPFVSLAIYCKEMKMPEFVFREIEEIILDYKHNGEKILNKAKKLYAK